MPTISGSITANGQSVSATSLKDTVITVLITGTYSNVELISEGSFDGATFFAIGMKVLETGIIAASSGLSSNKTVALIGDNVVRDLNTYRIRCTAFGSGSVSVTIRTTKNLVEPAPLETLLHGQTIVGTAGSPVILLSGSQATHTVTITAKPTNTGNMFFGLTGVTASNGYILPPGASISVDHNHALSNLYIDSAVNGEGVSYIGSVI